MSWKRVWLGALILALGVPCGVARAKKKKAPPEPRVDEVVFTGLEGFELPGKVTVPPRTKDEDVTRVNLVISGTSVMVRTGEEEIVDLLRHGQGVLNILPLSGVKEQVDARIVELYPEGRRVAGRTPADQHVDDQMDRTASL